MLFQKFTALNPIFYVILYTLIFFIPDSAYSDNIKMSAWINIDTKQPSFNNLNRNEISQNALGFHANKTFTNISSKLALGYSNKHNLSFDQSYIQLKSKNKIFGIGKINRNWSFSPNTSLILSNSARPSSSIYFLLDNKKKSQNGLFSWMGPWSFETFNSLLSNQNGIKNPMLLGIRVVINPTHNFKFELTKSSQWGGNGYNKNLSALAAAIYGNTNESANSNINQLAGFGFSFLSNSKNINSRIYTQFIGEDESGNLPTCYMNLIGNELEFLPGTFFTKIGFEYVDTRIGSTSNGHCGANTAYNNNIYNYTNYDTVLGTAIDTEGKSLEIWASSKLSDRTDINYSIKRITINDANWSNHRLSTNKQLGWLTNLEANWKINSIEINSRLTYQDFSLDKAKIKDGISLKISTKYIF